MLGFINKKEKKMKIGFKTLNNIILVLFLITIGCKDHENNKLVLPRDFKFKVSAHINELCKNNSRYTGSDFEKQAANYINKQFSEIGLH